MSRGTRQSLPHLPNTKVFTMTRSAEDRLLTAGQKKVESANPSSALAVIESIAKIIASVALPIVLLVLGNWYTESQKDKDIGQKYVEIAVGILADAPTEEALELRSWAVEIVNRYSEVKMTSTLADVLVMQEALPLQVQNAPRQGFRPFEGSRAVEKIIISDTQQKNVDVELKALDEIGVSYHYLVTEEGAILGLVSENDIAFHTSRHNLDSIGIGVMHISGEDYPLKQVETLSKLVRDVAARYNITSANIFSKDELDPRKTSDFLKISDRILEDL